MKALKITLLILVISFTNKITAQTKVYRTVKGERYHKKECKIIVKRKVIELTIKKAKFKGYVACKVCKPKNKVKTGKKVFTEKKKSNKVKLKKRTSKKSTATRCTATTKKGTRCKRRTKNASGKCWQH